MSATSAELFQVRTEVAKATRWSRPHVLVTLPPGFVFARAEVSTMRAANEFCVYFSTVTKARAEEARVMRAVLVRMLDNEAPNARYSLPSIERVKP